MSTLNVLTELHESMMQDEEGENEVLYWNCSGKTFQCVST